jgi:HSP20 family protein
MVSLTRYDPFGELFDDFFKGFVVRPVRGNGRDAIARRLKLDVTEQDSAFKVLAEIPGVKKDDIQVTIDGDQVAISAEVKQEKDVREGERVVHSERYFGKVSRAFRLGYDIDEAKVQAKYADGVLELTLPKKQTAETRKITIQ